MEQELTLHTLKPLLLQSDAENCSDALFLKKLFYHIVDESVMQKKLICKSASSLKAFMQGNRRRNRQQKRTYANYHGTELLKKTFQLEDRDQLFQNETLHQLAYNIDTMMAEAKISDWRAVQISIFKMLNEEMVYGSDMLNDIKELYRQNKISRIIAVVVLIAIFQETISDVFCWLTPKNLGEMVPAIQKAAIQMLHQAAEEQGRMLAFHSVSHKIDMPGIGNLLSTALGVQNHHIDSILVESEQNNCESLRTLFSNSPYPNIMLTGTGGAGKTFLLLDLGESLLRENSSLIPIYIPLNLLNYNTIGKQESPILHHFYQILSEEKQLPYEQFLSMLQAESDVFLFFLLDGYNEISSETAKNQLLLEIKEMKRKYPAIRFLITSRNNLADCFSTGGELPFLCKRVNPPTRYANPRLFQAVIRNRTGRTGMADLDAQQLHGYFTKSYGSCDVCLHAEKRCHPDCTAAPSPTGNNRRTHLQLHRTGETHTHTERNVRRTGTDEFRHADALLYRLLHDQKRQLSYG